LAVAVVSVFDLSLWKCGFEELSDFFGLVRFDPDGR
jgi:hypothetical protein